MTDPLFESALCNRHCDRFCFTKAMYRRGEGVTQNWQRAIIWYRKAAVSGNVAAMHWLGRIYGGQEDYPPDSERAAQWLKLAANEGDMQSQCSLGVCYIKGDGVDRDARLGAYWYRMAADQGDEWACYLLGLCYRDGTGVKRNSRWARHWFGKAASQGVKEARKELARMERQPKLRCPTHEAEDKCITPAEIYLTEELPAPTDDDFAGLPQDLPLPFPLLTARIRDRDPALSRWVRTCRSWTGCSGRSPPGNGSYRSACH